VLPHDQDLSHRQSLLLLYFVDSSLPPRKCLKKIIR
jgi:hypothetical protein